MTEIYNADGEDSEYQSVWRVSPDDKFVQADIPHPYGLVLVMWRDSEGNMHTDISCEPDVIGLPNDHIVGHVKDFVEDLAKCAAKRVLAQEIKEHLLKKMYQNPN